VKNSMQVGGTFLVKNSMQVGGTFLVKNSMQLNREKEKDKRER
jgi:hypothetical protein